VDTIADWLKSSEVNTRLEARIASDKAAKAIVKRLAWLFEEQSIISNAHAQTKFKAVEISVPRQPWLFVSLTNLQRRFERIRRDATPLREKIAIWGAEFADLLSDGAVVFPVQPRHVEFPRK
jgi:hypothetical protein